MAGAVTLAARAALAAGAGLVQMIVPDVILDQVAPVVTCATSRPMASTAAGRFARRSVTDILRATDRADVIALGPGLGNDDDTLYVVRSLLENTSAATVVVDADALNALTRAGGAGILLSRPRQLIITPHPAEAARLLGLTTAAVQADRPAAARQLSAGGIVAVLKGAGTLVCDGQRLYENSTGNPGMATGGTGDVLTGIIAALAAQGLTAVDAAVLGVHLHGRAGDLAAAQYGPQSMTAESLLNCLPQAFAV